MRIWARTPWDAVPLTITIVQLAGTFGASFFWGSLSMIIRIVVLIATALVIHYNIVVVSHFFIHAPWFKSDRLNVVLSMANSINIGQSVQIYQLMHVRNHHRHNNDEKSDSGTTLDFTSTYRNGAGGNHAPVVPYVVRGAFSIVVDRFREIWAVRRLWHVGHDEERVLMLAALAPRRRIRELRQVQLDRAAHCIALLLFLLISWQWTVTCYGPAFFLALLLVNLQNYYRHYGAQPRDRTSNAVSYYGRLYNRFFLNDGYHQEHHLEPGAHWRQLPAVGAKNRSSLNSTPRVVSPVPAVLGFLDYRRPLLHLGVAERCQTLRWEPGKG